MAEQEHGGAGLPPLASTEVSTLLQRFGVVPVAARDCVEAVVAEELQRLGHEARVVELRHGRLLLETTATAARLMRYDEAQLLRALESRVPGVVRELRVRVRPAGRTRVVREGRHEAHSPQHSRGETT